LPFRADGAHRVDFVVEVGGDGHAADHGAIREAGAEIGQLTAHRIDCTDRTVG